MSNGEKEKLDKVFRAGSDARKVADLMLDGTPRTRKELADEAGTSDTQIPRVKRQIEKHRIAKILTSIAEDGRSTIFQREQLPNSDGNVKDDEIVSVVFAAQRRTVEIDTTAGRYEMRFNGDGSVTVCTPKQEITIV